MTQLPLGVVGVAVGTALIINLRMMLYSAALAPAYGQFSKRWRFGLAALLVAQLNGEATEARQILVRPELHVRGSTGPAPILSAS